MSEYEQKADFDAASGADEEERERRAKPAPVLSEDELKTIVSGLLGRSVATSTMSLLSRLFAEHAAMKREVELLRVVAKYAPHGVHVPHSVHVPGGYVPDWPKQLLDSLKALEDFDAAKPGAGEEG